jgi:hypothetical protein
VSAAILISFSERGHSCPQQHESARWASRFAAIAADKNVRAPSKWELLIRGLKGLLTIRFPVKMHEFTE